MIPDFPLNIRIRLAWLKSYFVASWRFSVSAMLVVSAFLNWDSQQGRVLVTLEHNKIKFQSGQSYSYIMRKVCYHQIWIQKYLGVIESNLIKILGKIVHGNNLKTFLKPLCQYCQLPIILLKIRKKLSPAQLPQKSLCSTHLTPVRKYFCKLQALSKVLKVSKR